VRTSSRIYLLKFLGGVQADDQLVGVHNVVGVHTVNSSLDTGDVGSGSNELDISGIVEDQVLLAGADSSQESNNGLGLELVSSDLVNDDQVAVGSLVRQGAEQSQALDLLVDGVRVITRLGAESNTTVGPLRSADRALTCVAGALLAPRLFAAAADFLADLGVLGALALVGQEVDDSWTAFSFGVIPNTASESSTVETFLPLISTTSNLAIVFSSFTL